MQPTERIKEYAKRQAVCSVHRFRVGAVVYSGTIVLGSGYNQPNKTHPRAKPPYYSIHAELSAILRASSLYSPEALKGSCIYVHRVRRDGKTGLSKPCSWCQRLLAQVGIKEIYYSESNTK